MSRIARVGAGLVVGCLFSVLTMAATGSAEPLKGAEAALEALRDPKAKEPKGIGPILFRDIQRFEEEGAKLPADLAAKRWLELLNRYEALPPGANIVDPEQGETLDFDALLRALPSPAAWDAIAAGIEQRTPKGQQRKLDHLAMLLIAHTLKEDSPAQWRDIAAMLPMTAKGQQGEKALVLRLHRAMAERSGDPARIVASWEMGLTQGDEYGGGGQMPDLVAMVGPAQAEKILRRLLTTHRGSLEPTGTETTRLAQKLAIELAQKLRSPQWGLAASMEGAPLYEALRARYERPGVKPAPRPLGDVPGRGMGGMDPKRRATQYYFLNQVIAGRNAEATKLLNGGKLFESGESEYYGRHAFSEIDDPSQQIKIARFLRDILAKSPNTPLWQIAFQLPAQVQDRQALTETAIEALKKQDLAIGIRRQLRGLLYQQLLAQDRPLEAVPHLLALVTSRERTQQAERIHLAQAIQLARLGYLLKNPTWFEQGVKLAKEVQAEVEELGERGGFYEDYQLAQLMIDVDRPDEAERYFLEALRKLSAQPNFESMGGSILTRLAGIYHRAGRHADVMKLLTEAPAWGAQDVRDLMAQRDYDGTPVPQMAAVALAAQGRSAEAVRVLESVIQAATDFDPAYEALVKIQGSGALPFLEKLVQKSKFQERPLIWKGAALLKAGRLAEAEAAIKAAIAIDPSDGEQHFGRRMRVYAVMADIQEAKGDKKQADFFRGVVKAIRSSEEADQFAQVGLLTRGIKMYEGALDYFSDAYCIQSRLAVQLASQGRTEEAAERFKKAFELMPDSFGRVETHCFGCEGVFSSKQAEIIAEKVFREIAAKNPTKPQIHYLLGYLRSSQNRPTEALVHYRQAVKLDPDYLNAWKKIAELGNQIVLPSADRDAASLALFRLDPNGEGSRQLNNVASPKALWTTVAALQGEPKDETDQEPLLVLTASKKALEKSGQGQQMQQIQRFRGNRGRFMGNYYDPEGEGGIPTPGQALVQHAVISGALQVYQTAIQVRLQAMQNGVGNFLDR